MEHLNFSGIGPEIAIVFCTPDFTNKRNWYSWTPQETLFMLWGKEPCQELYSIHCHYRNTIIKAALTRPKQCAFVRAQI